jgi:hypothetical protein
VNILRVPLKFGAAQNVPEPAAEWHVIDLLVEIARVDSKAVLQPPGRVTGRGEQEMVRVCGILALGELLGHVTHTVVPDVVEKSAITDEHAVNVEHERLERHLVVQWFILLKLMSVEWLEWHSMSLSWFLTQLCQRARLPPPLVTISSVPTTMLFCQAAESWSPPVFQSLSPRDVTVVLHLVLDWP